MKTHKSKPIEETLVAIEVDIVVLEAPENEASAAKSNGGNTSGSHGNGSAGLAPNGGGASGNQGNGSGG